MQSFQTAPSLKRSHWLVLACLLFVASCAWSHPPAKRSVPHKSLKLATGGEESPATREVSRRHFYLSDIGLWALEYPSSLRDDTPAVPKIETGELYAIQFQESYRGKLNTKETHLFVAVLQRAWGYMFQRLDVEPLRHLSHADTISITQNLVGADSEHWCIAEQPEECPAPGPKMRTIYYDLNADKQIDVPSPDKWSSAMPVQPTESRGNTGSERDSRLMIRTSVSREFPYRPTGGYESNCQLPESSTNLYPIDGLRDVSHPVAIEAQNRFHGTDALLKCSKKRATLKTPGLFRPPLESEMENIQMTPFVSAGQLTVKRSSPRHLRNLLSFGANLGARDILGAYLLQQKLVDTASMQQAEATNRFLLGGMAIAAAAGYPEAGLRYGYFARQKMWNSNFNLPFRIGELYILNGLGLEHATVRYQRNLDSFELPEEAEKIKNWIAWNRARDLGFRQLPEAKLPEQKDWQKRLSASSKKGSRAAAHWQLAKSMIPEENKSAPGSLPSVNLPDKLRGLEKLTAEDKEPQYLSPYGHNFTKHLKSARSQDNIVPLAKRLAYVPETGLPTGFNASDVTGSSLGAIDQLLVLASLVGLKTSRDSAIEAFEERLKQTVISREICHLTPPQRLFEFLQLRPATPRGISTFISAVLEEAPKLCEHPRAFLERLIQQSQAQSEPRRILYELMEFTLRSFEGPQVRHRLIETLLEEVKVPLDICRRWRLSRVFAYLESGRLDNALEQFDNLSTCGEPSEETHEPQTELARLLLSYEKSRIFTREKEGCSPEPYETSGGDTFPELSGNRPAFELLQESLSG